MRFPQPLSTRTFARMGSQQPGRSHHQEKKEAKPKIAADVKHGMRLGEPPSTAIPADDVLTNPLLFSSKWDVSVPPQPEILQSGVLLISDPSLRDGIFTKSVILLAEHSKEGAFGLILNQPTRKTVGHYLKDEEFASLARIPVFVGGPVAKEHLTFSAIWKDSNGELGYQVRISAQQAAEWMQKPGVLVRAFLGYSGWDAGQLEAEMENHSWVSAAAPDGFLSLAHDESLWENTLSPLSAYHRLLALCPANPWLN